VIVEDEHTVSVYEGDQGGEIENPTSLYYRRVGAPPAATAMAAQPQAIVAQPSPPDDEAIATDQILVQ
jgi:hypothetical protein